MSRFPTAHDRSSIRGMAQATIVEAQAARTFRFSKSLTPAQVAANSSGTETVSVTCASGDDVTIQSPSGQTAGIVVTAAVTGQDEVTVTFSNVTGSAATPKSGDYLIRVFKHGSV